MSTTNLFEETDGKITKIGKTWDDVEWCGATDSQSYYVWKKDDYVTIPPFSITADEFQYLSKNISYNNGYGAQEINPWLVVVFKDGTWLEREEYDGSEWWHYKGAPQRPDGTYMPSADDILPEG